ncbi:MAG TPA: hypothetical protein DIT48_04920 [Actinobacteria bacterium]|nr:hypothetical protein [Actinomycetota bacterium]
MDGAHPRTVRRQPHHPARLRLHRPARPALHPHRGSSRRRGLRRGRGGCFMRVSEIMTNAAVIDASDDTLAEAARKMWKQQTGSLLVVDGEELVGIITERDVLKAVATGVPLEDTRISEVMTKDVTTVGPGTSLREAAKIMADLWIRHLPVLDSGKLVGVLSQRDLAGVLAGALNEPEALQQLVEASELVRDHRLRRIEHGAWD